MNEKKLLIKLKRKSYGALECAVNLYSGYVTSIVYRYIGKSVAKEDVEETVADAFILLWQNADKLNEEYGSIKPYLGMIARNCAYNKVHQQPRIQNISFDEIEELLADTHLEEAVGSKELNTFIKNVIESLQEPDRELFIRYYFHEEKLKKIASDLNINQSTAKTKLARTRKFLASQLDKEGYGYEK